MALNKMPRKTINVDGGQSCASLKAKNKKKLFKSVKGIGGPRGAITTTKVINITSTEITLIGV